jgi:hypothetical protein
MENETIADIVAQMRNLGNLDEKSTDKIPRSLMGLGFRTYADRIEAAEKREYDFPKSQSVDADKLTGKDINGVIDDLLKSSKYYYHRGDIVHGQFCRVTADRIREAWKREKDETEAAAPKTSRHRIVVPIEIKANAAAMREALVAMVKAETDGSMEREDLCGRCLSKLFDKCKHDGSCWVDKVMAALSAPPRNCDVMDWRTAWAKWRTENHPQKPVGYSECYESTTMFMDWYTGTAERKGESDGSK